MLDGHEVLGESDWKGISVINTHDVWTVGRSWSPNQARGNSTLSHWNGEGWTDVTLPSAFYGGELWAAPNGEVWILSGLKKVTRWNGASFQTYDTGSTEVLDAIWGTSSNDVWVAGRHGTIIHWDGNTWSKEFSRPDKGPLDMFWSVWGLDSNRVWLRGSMDFLHWNGTRWNQQPTPQGVRLASLSSWNGSDVWATSGSALYRYDGTTWIAEQPLTRESSVAVDDFAMTRPNDVWFNQRPAGLRHWNGASWSRLKCGFHPKIQVLEGSSSGEIWALGWDGFRLHWDGSEGREPPPIPPSMTISTVGGANAADIWIPDVSVDIWWEELTPAGWKQRAKWDEEQRMTLHWDGLRWHRLPAASDAGKAQAFWTDGSEVLSVVAGRLFRWDGSQWNEDKKASELLLNGVSAVWGTSKNDLWIAGYHIAHWDGARWTRFDGFPTVPTGDIGIPSGIRGRASDDVWIWSERDLLHWDGTEWQNLRKGLDPGPVYDLWPDGPGSLWLVDTSGLQHQLEGRWTAVLGSRFPKNFAVSGAVIRGADSIWVLGSIKDKVNIVLRWTGTGWETIAEGIGTAPWTGLWSPGPGEVWAYGGASNLYRLIIPSIASRQTPEP